MNKVIPPDDPESSTLDWPDLMKDFVAFCKDKENHCVIKSFFRYTKEVFPVNICISEAGRSESIEAMSSFVQSTVEDYSDILASLEKKDEPIVPAAPEEVLPAKRTDKRKGVPPKEEVEEQRPKDIDILSNLLFYDSIADKINVIVEAIYYTSPTSEALKFSEREDSSSLILTLLSAAVDMFVENQKETDKRQRFDFEVDRQKDKSQTRHLDDSAGTANLQEPAHISDGTQSSTMQRMP